MSSKDKLRSFATVCGLTFLVSPVVAGGAGIIDQTDQAYQHYRCDALLQLGRITEADKKVCDDLKADGFDLAAWAAGNRDQSIQLHEEIFSEFF